MTPRQWQNLLKRLERRQTVQSVADLKKISKNIRTLRAEIAGSLATWEALASQGDRTGLMMAAHLKRMTGNLDRIMGNASQALNHDLEKSWQKWWAMGGESTLQMAKAGGMAVTELAMAADKLNLYQNYIPDLIKSVADQTKTKLANYVRTAALAGTPRNEVQKGMLQILLGEPARFDRGRFGGFAYQVERIYRTESQRLYNMAGQQAAETLMETTGADLVKVWNHPGADDTARPDHVDMDGETVEVDEPFSNGLMYPKDPAGSAEDTINCRCWASYVPREKQAGDEVAEPEPEPEPEQTEITDKVDVIAPEPEPSFGFADAASFLSYAEEATAAERAAVASSQVELLKAKAAGVGGEQLARLQTDQMIAAKRLRLKGRETLLERFPEPKRETKLKFKLGGYGEEGAIGDAAQRSALEGAKFVDRLTGGGLPTIKVESVYGRPSHYVPPWKPGGPKIVLNDIAGPTSMSHEMGHMIEEQVAGVHETILDFYKARTKGEALVTHPDGWKWKPDKWGEVEEYAGRWYASLERGQYASEVLSVGIEQLAVDPIAFAEADPEYFGFIMKVLEHVRRVQGGG